MHDIVFGYVFRAESGQKGFAQPLDGFFAPELLMMDVREFQGLFHDEFQGAALHPAVLLANQILRHA